MLLSHYVLTGVYILFLISIMHRCIKWMLYSWHLHHLCHICPCNLVVPCSNWWPLSLVCLARLMPRLVMWICFPTSTAWQSFWYACVVRLVYSSLRISSCDNWSLNCRTPEIYWHRASFHSSACALHQTNHCQRRFRQKTIRLRLVYFAFGQFGLLPRCVLSASFCSGCCVHTSELLMFNMKRRCSFCTYCALVEIEPLVIITLNGEVNIGFVTDSEKVAHVCVGSVCSPCLPAYERFHKPIEELE